MRYTFFFSSGNDFEVIRARILELIVLLSRAAVEGGANVEEIFGLNFKYFISILNNEGNSRGLKC